MFEYVLSVMIFLPILAGLVMLFVPVGNGIARIAGFIVSIVILILGVELFLGFSGTGGMEYVEQHGWIESLGISYSIGIDGISLLVLFACAVLFPVRVWSM